jgi:hypothetical protein
MVENFIAIWKDKQLRNLSKEVKLTEFEMKTIMNKLDNPNIFSGKCSVWTSNYEKRNGIYVNHYKNKKKNTLHKLIYSNFIEDIMDKRIYLKHTCSNYLCLNINHLRPKKEKPAIEQVKLQISLDVRF